MWSQAIDLGRKDEAKGNHVLAQDAEHLRSLLHDADLLVLELASNAIEVVQVVPGEPDGARAIAPPPAASARGLFIHAAEVDGHDLRRRADFNLPLQGLLNWPPGHPATLIANRLEAAFGLQFTWGHETDPVLLCESGHDGILRAMAKGQLFDAARCRRSELGGYCRRAGVAA